MKALIIALGIEIVSMLLASCADVSPRPRELPDPPQARSSQAPIATGEPPRLLSLVTRMPENAPAAEMARMLQLLFPEIAQAKDQDLPSVTEALATLRKQPAAVSEFTKYYKQLPPQDYWNRLLIMGLLGELRRPDAMPVFREVIWSRLPEKRAMPEGLSSRDFEEMIQAKAVHGLAYLRSGQADEAVRDVILKHEAKLVRVAAIDSYMWNHGDSKEVAKQLYDLLPTDLHQFVERPRFHQGMDPQEFTNRLNAWREKWTQPTP